MLSTNKLDVLITYCTIVESFFIMLSVAGVLWLRHKRPKMPRPIKVNFNKIRKSFYLICIKFYFIFCLNCKMYFTKLKFLDFSLDSNCVCCGLCISSDCSMLRTTIWSWHGITYYVNRYSCLFSRSLLEKETYEFSKI